MLTVFVATFVIFALVILGMSLGYLIKRKTLQGSCGGISSLGLEKVCDCPEPCDARKNAWLAKRSANGIASFKQQAAYRGLLRFTRFSLSPASLPSRHRLPARLPYENHRRY